MNNSSFLFQFLIRVFAAIVVVLLTYNPTGWSYVHWVSEGFTEQLPLKVLAGIVLMIAYAVLIRSTIYSIRIVGVVMVALLIAAIVWVMVDFGVLTLEKPGVLDWVVLLGIGFILGVGLSWAIIRRRLSGQYTVDEADVNGGEN